MRQGIWSTIASILAVLAFFGGWEAYVRLSEVSPFVLPAPSAVAEALWSLLQRTSTYHHAWVTFYETVIGFFAALVIGVGLGTLLGKLPWLHRALHPFVIASQVVPKIALVPLFILWFGFGPTSKIVIAAVLAFFPILTNTLLGIRSVSAGHIDVMRSLGASPWQTFLNLEMRSALPYILAGTEMAIVLALIGAVVGEYLGGSQGLGYLAVSTLNAYQVDRLFAVILLLTALGLLLYMVVVFSRRVLIRYPFG